MNTSLSYSFCGVVLLLLFSLRSLPPQTAQAPLGLRVTLVQPNRVYSLTDTLEVVLHNPGTAELQVLGRTVLLPLASRTTGQVLLAHNVSQTEAAARVMATPPCLRVAPRSRIRERWPVRQVLGYSGYTPARLVRMAGGPVLRIEFSFKDCRGTTDYTPPWTLRVRP